MNKKIASMSVVIAIIFFGASTALADTYPSPVSVSSSGTPANNTSSGGLISGNNRFILFTTIASNVVQNDTNFHDPNLDNLGSDAFLRDLQTGVTSRVSLASDGSQGHGDSIGQGLSQDGRYIVFFSRAFNIVTGDTNGTYDVFVRDAVSSSTQIVSVAPDGSVGNGSSQSAAVSSDGRYVAFISSASNLVSGDTNSVDDVFLRDLQSGITTRVDVSSSGAEANGGAPQGVAMSSDGRYIVFNSGASNLVSGDTNGVTDTFLHDMSTGNTERISVAENGDQGNDASVAKNLSVSTDGRYVGFQSFATNLIDNDNNLDYPDVFGEDIFVHDRLTGTNTIADVSSDEVQASADKSLFAMSENGRFIAFSSFDNRLRGGTSQTGPLHTYVRDIFTGQTAETDINDNGSPAIAVLGSISADGKFLTIASTILRSQDTTPLMYILENPLYSNLPPTFTAIDDKSINEGEMLQFIVSATDPEGGNLTYSVANLPSGATFDPQTRTFSWTPDSSQSGTYSGILFSVADDGIPSGSSTESITITVNNVNRAPQIGSIGNKSVVEGATLAFTVSGSDPDSGDVLAYSASNLPSGATLDSVTGNFSWTPSFSQAGTYSNVRFFVSDDGTPIASSSESITISVSESNRPPVLTPVGTITVDEGQQALFTIGVSDPDGNVVTVGALNAPLGSTYATSTRTFSWTPNFSQSGTYTVNFIGTDNGTPSSSATTSATIVVNDVSPITLTASGDSLIRQGQSNRNEGANPHLTIQNSGNNRAVVAFNSATVQNYVSAHGVSSAKLIFTIQDNGNNWGQTGRTVSAHPLLQGFTEGNGKDSGLPANQSTRGSGSGVTWSCATDTAIEDSNTDCNPHWNGGSFASATAAAQTIQNNQTGEIQWDVTQDVLSGTTNWLIKLTNEGQNGNVDFYSKEGASAANNTILAPRLILTP